MLLRTWRSWFWMPVVFAAFALWIPLRLGIGFLDTVVLGAYATVGVVLAAPMAAASGKVGRPVLVGTGAAWAMLIAGVGAVYATRNVVVGPDFLTLGKCALFGLMLTGAVSSATAFAAKATSEGMARMVARVVLLALLTLFFFQSRRLPDVAVQGAVVSGAAWLAFGILLRRRAV